VLLFCGCCIISLLFFWLFFVKLCIGCSNDLSIHLFLPLTIMGIPMFVWNFLVLFYTFILFYNIFVLLFLSTDYWPNINICSNWPVKLLV
jgi:hypothetical protein